ncbi:protein singed [Pseudomonas syringae]|uniref:protein singed n=1 Tax=Pseudomonas syringae TaxID=317 RepID=UPI001F329DD1|nr:protein singed [Pseudomonas syringae]MBL3827614.1 protein singed [Pseudomonas syringae pv. theae]MBL3836818.1 protein singed [Pseudomonas syringae pv. theae]MBL3866858.1 protein singed [Pseudomonas syringae pv. theae]GKQ44380.1 protein singed [Pseudomonas syringae pv. theae]
MATYITVADVDAALGASWAPEGQKARAVMQANAYMTSLSLADVDMKAIPEEVVQAGVELAQVAASGKLYQQQTEGSIASKTVKAGSVSTSKTFASIDTSKSTSLPDGLQFALALLAPWRSSAFSFNVYR